MVGAAGPTGNGETTEIEGLTLIRTRNFENEGRAVGFHVLDREMACLLFETRISFGVKQPLAIGGGGVGFPSAIPFLLAFFDERFVRCVPTLFSDHLPSFFHI